MAFITYNWGASRGRETYLVTKPYIVKKCKESLWGVTWGLIWFDSCLKIYVLRNPLGLWMFLTYFLFIVLKVRNHQPDDGHELSREWMGMWRPLCTSKKLSISPQLTGWEFLIISESSCLKMFICFRTWEYGLIVSIYIIYILSGCWSPIDGWYWNRNLLTMSNHALIIKHYP